MSDKMPSVAVSPEPAVMADVLVSSPMGATMTRTMPAPLYYLALGAFAVGTEGFMIAAVLPKISADLSVSIQMAGQLVTAFTLVYALSSPVLTALAGNMNRRYLLLLTMLIFAAGNILAAFATGYWSLLAARVVLALAAGLYGPNANALATTLVTPERRGRALALVNGGLSIAVALGVPMGAFVGNHFGWRVNFVGVAGLAFIALGGLALGIPKTAGMGLRAPSLRERFAVIRQPHILPALLVTTLWALGGYEVYTYIAPFLAVATGIEGSAVGVVLFCWGTAAFLGLMLGGVAHDKIGARPAIITTLIVMAAALMLLSVAATWLRPDLALIPVFVSVIAWGLSAWGFFPSQQARLIGLAGARHAPIILSLNGSFMYLGFALGAALGSVTLSTGGVADLGFVGAICVVAAFLLFVATDRRPPASAI